MSGHSKQRCRLSPRPIPCLVGAMVLVLAAATGCRDDAATQLEGVWIGQPAKPATGAPEVGVAEDVAHPTTDFEQFDAAVKMNFVSEELVELDLIGASQPVRGTWEVVEATPGMLLIEIVTPVEPSASEAAAGSIRRRFELEPTYDEDRLIGFDLREDGADRKLGTVAFRRAESVAPTRAEVDAPAAAPVPPGS